MDVAVVAERRPQTPDASQKTASHGHPPEVSKKDQGSTEHACTKDAQVMDYVIVLMMLTEHTIQ